MFNIQIILYFQHLFLRLLQWYQIIQYYLYFIIFDSSTFKVKWYLHSYLIFYCSLPSSILFKFCFTFIYLFYSDYYSDIRIFNIIYIQYILLFFNIQFIFLFRLLQRYQNVKAELEAQQNLERVKMEKLVRTILFRTYAKKSWFYFIFLCVFFLTIILMYTIFFFLSHL